MIKRIILRYCQGCYNFTYCLLFEESRLRTSFIMMSLQVSEIQNISYFTVHLATSKILYIFFLKLKLYPKRFS